MTPSLIVASIALGIWIYIVLFRGGFWLSREREAQGRPTMQIAGDWPSVVAVIPARNERVALPRTLASLSAQDYPGRVLHRRGR